MEDYLKKFVVETGDTAKEVGSGDLEVLATPMLLSMVENTAKEYLHSELASEETSVCTAIDVKHLSPSKVGAQIVVKIKVTSQEKLKINFSFTIFDDEKLVGIGTHQRAIVLIDVFMNKLLHADKKDE